VWKFRGEISSSSLPPFFPGAIFMPRLGRRRRRRRRPSRPQKSRPSPLAEPSLSAGKSGQRSRGKREAKWSLVRRWRKRGTTKCGDFGRISEEEILLFPRIQTATIDRDESAEKKGPLGFSFRLTLSSPSHTKGVLHEKKGERVGLWRALTGNERV